MSGCSPQLPSEILALIREEIVSRLDVPIDGSRSVLASIANPPVSDDARTAAQDLRACSVIKKHWQKVFDKTVFCACLWEVLKARHVDRLVASARLRSRVRNVRIVVLNGADPLDLDSTFRKLKACSKLTTLSIVVYGSMPAFKSDSLAHTSGCFPHVKELSVKVVANTNTSMVTMSDILDACPNIRYLALAVDKISTSTTSLGEPVRMSSLHTVDLASLTSSVTRDTTASINSLLTKRTSQQVKQLIAPSFTMLSSLRSSIADPSERWTGIGKIIVRGPCHDDHYISYIGNFPKVQIVEFSCCSFLSAVESLNRLPRSVKTAKLHVDSSKLTASPTNEEIDRLRIRKLELIVKGSGPDKIDNQQVLDNFAQFKWSDMIRAFTRNGIRVALSIEPKTAEELATVALDDIEEEDDPFDLRERFEDSEEDEAEDEEREAIRRRALDLELAGDQSSGLIEDDVDFSESL